MPCNPITLNTCHCEDERIDHVVAEFLAKEEAGQCPDPEAWLNRYPDLRPALSSFFRNHQACKRADAQSVVSSGVGHAADSNAAEDANATELVQPGDVIGDCRIIRLLGRGGMGVVYQAEHVRLKDLRAMKFLPRGTVTDNMLRRFWREAQTAASIKHPNVISVHDVGQQKIYTTSSWSMWRGVLLPIFARTRSLHGRIMLFPGRWRST